jgi:hypothetical protein
MTTRRLWKGSGARVSIQSVRFILSVSGGSESRGDRFSERILQRRVEEVAGLVRPRVVDESAGEKIAVARVTLQVAGEVIGGEEIGLRADVAGRGSVSRTEHSRGLVVDRVVIGRAPEKILLERERKIVDWADGDAGVGSDDVLPSDVVDVAKKRMAVRVELVEGADPSAGLLVSACIVELKVDAGRQVLDRKGVAEDGREHPSADIFGAYRAELPSSF